MIGCIFIIFRQRMRITLLYILVGIFLATYSKFL